MSRRIGARAEDLIASGAVIALVVLPLAEIVVRQVLVTGIPGAGPFTQHLTLAVAMLGAAIAARDGKLLAMATGTLLPDGRFRRFAQVFVNAVGGAVAAVFTMGGIALVRLEWLSGSTIAAGVPTWVAACLLPIGFGLIALRLAWRAAPMWPGRGAAAVGIALGLLVGARPALLEDLTAWPVLVLLAVAAILGAPIFALIGGATMVLFLMEGTRPVVPLITGYSQLTSVALPAIPLFTLAGFVLAAGRSSERLLRLFRACFGWMRGGTAVVTATLCACFTTFTGGSGVAILALGGLLLPALAADRYRERFSIGLITASGSLGLLFPPSVPLILYSIIAASAAIEDLFIGGLLPGVLMLALVSALGVREGWMTGTPPARFAGGEALAAAWAARWELLLPLVVLIALFSGVATPVEAAAVAAFGALVVQRYIHRDLASTRHVVRVTTEAVALTGGVLIILAVAAGLTNYLVNAQAPMRLVEWTESHVESRLLFLFALNVFLLAAGCLMDIFSAIIVIVPLIVPVAEMFDIHPVHLGIIFIANLELGYLTPPVGLNLFLASYRFNRPLLEVVRGVLPMLAVLALGVLLITYVPWLTLGLLWLLGRA